MELAFVDDGPIVYNGPKIVDQFAIGLMTTMINTTQQNSKLTVAIPLRRISTNQLLKTFIPTMILCALGYSTMFVDIKRPGDRFMGAVTMMLVLATWITVINADLPKTSYVKLIDVWFVWQIVVTFIIIIYHIFLDRLRIKSIRTNIIKVGPCEQLNVENSNGAQTEEHTAKKINIIVIVFISIINCVFYGTYFFLALQ